MQAVVIHVDHDDLGRRIELRGEQGCEPDRAGTDNGDGRARLNLAVEHAAFKARGEDVTQQPPSSLRSPGTADRASVRPDRIRKKKNRRRPAAALGAASRAREMRKNG